MKRRITVHWNGKAFDIQMEESQRIATTLRILRENLWELRDRKPVTVRIRRSGRQVEPQNTYEQERIYTGEELVIVGEEREGNAGFRSEQEICAGEKTVLRGESALSGKRVSGRGAKIFREEREGGSAKRREAAQSDTVGAQREKRR